MVLEASFGYFQWLRSFLGARVTTSSLLVWGFPVSVLEVLTPENPRSPGKLGQAVTLRPSRPHPRNFNYERSDVKSTSGNTLALTVLKCMLFLPFPYGSDTENQSGGYQDCCFSTLHPCCCSSFLLEGSPSTRTPPSTPPDPTHPSVLAELTFSL